MQQSMERIVTNKQNHAEVGRANKKPFLFLLCAALLALVVKYSDSILQAIQMVFSLLTPILIGCGIAYVLNLLVVRLEHLPILARESSPLYRVRRAVSIIGALIIILAVLILLIAIIIPQLADAFRVMLVGIPPLLDELADWLTSLGNPTPRIEQWLNSLDINWPQFVQKAASYLTSGMGSIFSSAVSIVSNVGGIVMQFVIAFIFALYLLAGKERLAGQFRSLAEVYLKEKTYHRLMYVISTANDTFSKFFIGQFTEAIIIGVLCTVGMLIFRFPYATMVGTLVGATALLPVVGAYLGAGIGAFMIMTVNPLQAIAFLIYIAILQQLEGNLIYPRVVGSSIGLPGIWVLAAVTVGGGLGGIVGMLLAVPVSATLYKLIRSDVRKRKGQVPSAEAIS